MVFSEKPPEESKEDRPRSASFPTTDQIVITASKITESLQNRLIKKSLLKTAMISALIPMRQKTSMLLSKTHRWAYPITLWTLQPSWWAACLKTRIRVSRTEQLLTRQSLWWRITRTIMHNKIRVIAVRDPRFRVKMASLSKNWSKVDLKCLESRDLD